MTDASASYDPDSCCGEHCFAYGREPEEPCWGSVEAVDEVERDGEGWVWIHECRGHEDCQEEGWFEGEYKPEPNETRETNREAIIS